MNISFYSQHNLQLWQLQLVEGRGEVLDHIINTLKRVEKGTEKQTNSTGYASSKIEGRMTQNFLVSSLTFPFRPNHQYSDFHSLEDIVYDVCFKWSIVS